MKIQWFSFKNRHLNMSSAESQPFYWGLIVLAHWGRVTHICVSKLNVIGSDNGLSPDRRQAIIWTNGILSIEPLGTNLSEIWIEIQTFSFQKRRLNMSSAKCRPFCSGLIVWNVNLLTLLLAADHSTLCGRTPEVGVTYIIHPFPI